MLQDFLGCAKRSDDGRIRSRRCEIAVSQPQSWYLLPVIIITVRVPTNSRGWLFANRCCRRARDNNVIIIGHNIVISKRERLRFFSCYRYCRITLCILCARSCATETDHTIFLCKQTVHDALQEDCRQSWRARRQRRQKIMSLLLSARGVLTFRGRGPREPHCRRLETDWYRIGSSARKNRRDDGHGCARVGIVIASISRVGNNSESAVGLLTRSYALWA